MWATYFPYLMAGGLSAVYAIAGIIDVAKPGYVRARFRHQEYPRQFYRVMGVLQLITALFLAVPQLRIWGIIMAGFLTFYWVVILLNHRQWNWAVIGMLLMMALAPASLALY